MTIAPPASDLPPFERLKALMARLREPGGCPWDHKQTLDSLIPYTIEEVYEVIEAVESGDVAGLREELGDLAFHIAFYSRIAEEQGLFDLDAVFHEVTDKMVQRHPHVFGARDEAASAEAVVPIWEEMKRKEKARRQKEAAAEGEPAPVIPSVFDGLSSRLPALLWAFKVQQKMARVGFDWPDAAGVREKLAEELAELDHGMVAEDQDAIEEELGDVLFTLANLARHLAVNPEQALRRATLKFQNRFRHMEAALHREGRHPADTPLEELERLWQESKRQQR